jgi:hypothetical protein
MYSTYRLKASELNATFLETLKKMFKNREIEIVVHDMLFAIACKILELLFFHKQTKEILFI